MQTQRKASLRRPANRVNALSRGLAAALITAVSAMAPQAFAGAPLVDRVVEVRLDAAALDTEAGRKAAYETLQRKAMRACASDREALRLQKITAQACADDLLAQFVASAGHAELTRLHAGAVKLASAGTEPTSEDG